MMMEEREEKDKKNKRIGWITSISVQLVLLLLFYFIIAWKAPFPPIPEYGIELGFSSSSGAPSSAASSAPSEPETAETANPLSEVSESESIPEETSTSEPPSEPEVETNPTTEPVETQEPMTETTATPDEVEQVPEEMAEEPEEKEVDQRAVMGASSGNASTEGEETTELDSRAVYGNNGANTGSTEGASLSLSGWRWDSRPRPNDNSDENGKIVFEIQVDANGELRSIRTILSTVSQSVKLKYEQAVRELTFSQTSAGNPALLSKGTITFIIKSR